jgi:ABC-type dipeptide/oligopeptide/nickel transport system ATPase component
VPSTDPVAVRAVTKVYGEGDDVVRALDGVDLGVRRGEMVALVGPSGCGKSTLLNLVGCVDLPTSGTVEVDGRVTHELDDDGLTLLRRDRVGTVFQFFNLLPAMRVADNVGLPLVLQRVPRAEIGASTPRSRASGSRRRRAPIRRSSPAGRCSASRSRAPSSTARRSSSPTSRRGTSTPKPARRFSRSCARWPTVARRS